MTPYFINGCYATKTKKLSCDKSLKKTCRQLCLTSYGAVQTDMWMTLKYSEIAPT